jgi:hypothetical protein
MHHQLDLWAMPNDYIPEPTPNEKHAAALRGKRFEDHPRAKPTTRPVFVPARGESFVVREANC